MKIKKIAMVLLATVIFVSCTPAVTVAPRADNFSFVFKYLSCASIPLNVLDTKNGTLVHTPLGDTKSITFSFQLTDDELETIYKKSMAIGFFEYPKIFVIPDDQVLGYHSPSSSYEISITNGEMINSVTWKDDTMSKPDYKKADSLRELLNLIDQIIQSYLETQELPEPKGGCA